MGGDTAIRSTTRPPPYPKMASAPKGKQIHSIYAERLRQFLDDGQYAQDGLLAKMYYAQARGEPHVKLSVYSPPDLSRPTFKEATSHEFKPTSTGQFFGPSWSTHWFKVQIKVPEEIRKHDHIEFHWDGSNEGLVWTEDGEPLQGLTGGGEREEWILPESFRDGNVHTFYIEMACNGMFGNAPGGDTIQPPAKDKYYQLHKAEIVAVNLEARGLKIDFWIIGDAAREFPEDSWEEHEALQVGNSIMDCFIKGKGSDKCLSECRKIAQRYLGSKVDSSKVYDEGPDALVTAVGHCHIDTCWLWPWAETKRKVARSWSNQCNLMDRYPEHRFACSQAQQYKWLKMYYPTVFDRVKEKVKEGRFQPIGGSWVEHDTNLPSGESLVRQFLYGQRFFQSHFGERSTTFWLPDTFGYSSQLPQLCRLAGMTRFFTQKLSWNNINDFPHTTFNWVALDGSQVLCHMAPSETYTAEAHFGDVVRSVTQHKSMDQDPSSLLIFGKGDGGGGPTWEHIEKLRRCRGISDNIGRLPRVKMGDSVDDFFARLEQKAADGTDFVTWYGELYFELHRGTYTTQANNKRNNRKAEIMLHDIEYLATLATVQHLVSGKRNGYKYPKKDIDEMWENVLLCQFHDCLPGSSIEMCYDDSDELYEKAFKTGQGLLKDALHALGFRKEGQPVVLNTLPWTRSDFVQVEEGAKPQHILAEYGITPIPLQIQGPEPQAERSVHVSKISNDTYRLSTSKLNVQVSRGVITSIYDKQAKREIIAEGRSANQYVIFDDKPLYWQAWDVEVYHLESRQELQSTSTSILEDGPHKISLLTETRISADSWIKSTTSLSTMSSGGDGLVEFAAEVEWHEDKKFLKVEFPVNIRNTEASYETQFGIVRRPTHYNTSWDMAKFEVCCHKWADLSESSYGVSILNDSKYGFATQGNVMRLSLLRAPKAPDAHADLGRHYVRYAIYPHSGPLDSRTVHAARSFNHPVCSRNTNSAEPLFPWTDIYSYTHRHPAPAGIAPLMGAIHMSKDSDPAIIIDTIKRGEDDQDVSHETGLPVRYGKSIIVRLYDSLGGLARGRLEFAPLPVKQVQRCNLLEDGLSAIDIDEDGKGAKVEVKPFEVLTLRLVL